MYPCSTCDRHLRDTDRLCPFCGTVQSTIASSCFGTLMLTVALLGSTACARDPGSEGSTAGTTTTMTTTTATESGESSADGSTDTSTAGDGDGDTTDNTTNNSGSFYAGPEVDLSLSDCDPFVQDCPEGEKCVPYSINGSGYDADKCVPVNGSGAPGEPCLYGGIFEATDDCDATSYCWTDGGVDGVCLEFCQGSLVEPTCPDGFQCLIDGNGVINLCTASCNPLLQDCEPGFACHWTSAEFTCVATTEDLALGEPCEALNDCAQGLACLPGNLTPNCAGDSCCASYCDLSMPSCDQMGTQCAPFFDGQPPAGYEDVGVCVLP